jgi:hypothetical protein
MSGSIVWRLIAKDLYLFRWLIAGAVIVGLASIFAASVSQEAYGAIRNIAFILVVTCIVGLGVFLGIFCVLTERQTRSVLFVLSLPVTPMQYTTAKVGASLLAFLFTWVVLTGTIVASIIAFDPPPDGNLPNTVAMMVFFLANFCFLLSVGLTTTSEFWAVAGILGTNTAVPIYMTTVMPAIRGNPDGPVAVWSPAILTTLGIEAAVIVLSLTIAIYVQSRRKDFV